MTIRIHLAACLPSSVVLCHCQSLVHLSQLESERQVLELSSQLRRQATDAETLSKTVAEIRQLHISATEELEAERVAKDKLALKLDRMQEALVKLETEKAEEV